MARILLLILLVWILYAVIKRIIANSESSDSASTKHSHPDEKSAEQIVQCSQCGLHVPESDSHLSNNLITCNNPECNNIEHNDTEQNRKQ